MEHARVGSGPAHGAPTAHGATVLSWGAAHAATVLSWGAAHAATALSWAAAVLSLLIVVLHMANAGTPVDTWWFGNLCIAVGLGAVGTVLTRQVPGNPIGWLFLVGSVGQAIAGAGQEWAVFGWATHPGGLPAPGWAAWLGWTSVIGIATLPLVLLRFPDGRLRSHRWIWVQRAVIVAAVLAIITEAVYAGEFTPEMPGLTNPMGVSSPLLASVQAVAWIVVTVMVIPAALCLLLRFRGADRDLRRQLRWVTIFGVSLALEVVLESSVLPDGVSTYSSPVAVLLFVLTIGLAILRHELWDTDVLLNLSLVTVIVTVALGAVFIALVAVIGGVLDGRPVLWPAAIAAGVVILAFVPLRTRVQRGVDRMQYGRRGDPYRTLALLVRRLEDPADVDAVLRATVEQVAAASLRLDYVGLARGVDGPVVEIGQARTPVRRISLRYQGSDVGELLVAHRPGARLGRSAEAMLAGLADRVAQVVHEVDEAQRAQRARQAGAIAREEERRRVRRDLHDGLGPALAAIAMRVDGARLLVDRDPVRAMGVLSDLGLDVRSTIDDIRRLVYDLQPPVLDAVGLVSALAEQAAVFSGPVDSGPGLRVDFIAPDSIDRLPAAVEVAAYRIVCEALANVARHAGASRCWVVVELTAGRLALSVDDDGRGLDVHLRPGVGTGSMVERATELGGSCRITRSPMGGTKVQADLPAPGAVAAPASASERTQPRIAVEPETSADTAGAVVQL